MQISKYTYLLKFEGGESEGNKTFILKLAAEKLVKGKQVTIIKTLINETK